MFWVDKHSACSFVLFLLLLLLSSSSLLFLIEMKREKEVVQIVRVEDIDLEGIA